MLSFCAPRKLPHIALAASIALGQNLSALSQELPAHEAKRSLAASMPIPGAVSPKAPPVKTSAKRVHYTRHMLQDKAKAGYPKSHMEKGLYLKQKSDLNGALIEFLKATQENPHLVKGFYEQALIFRERGYRKLAESSLQQALASKPDYNEARVLLATVRLEQGNFGGAVQELSRSLGLSLPATPSETNNKTAITNGAIGSQSDIAQGRTTSDGNSRSSTKEGSPQLNSGLLSIALPAILQSVHGLLAPPVSNHIAQAPDDGETSASSAEMSAKQHPSDERKLAEDNSPPETRHIRKKRKAFLSYFKRGDQSEQDNLFKALNAGATDAKQTPESLAQKDSAPDDRVKLPWEIDSTESSAKQTNNTDAITPWQESKKDVVAEANDGIAGEGPKTTAQESPKPSNSIFGSATTFSAPERPISTAGILGSLFTSSPPQADGLAGDIKAPPPRMVKLDNDQWAKKLKFYVDHGSSAIKDGEAFMFSEDTGEASLFLADGTTIRRIVQQPKDANDVMRQRRPDIANPEDMLYGLSLLGKLIPKMDTSQPSTMSEPIRQPEGSFRGDNLMSGSQSFWGWLKSVWKF